MTEQPGDMAGLMHHPDYASAVPIPEHFLPVLYLAGMAAAASAPADVLVDGYTHGSLSMTAYTVGCATLGQPAELGGAAEIASSAPPESANV